MRARAGHTMPLVTSKDGLPLPGAVSQATSDGICVAGKSPEGLRAATQICPVSELGNCVEGPFMKPASAFGAQTRHLLDELWCMVWSFLPATDLLRVSHVSRRWRNIAICCAELWCRLDYRSDAHDDDCDCHSAESSFCLDGPGSSNLAMVEAYLSRSGNLLPISLSIELLGELASRDELIRLADALQPYIQRLVDMQFLSEDPDASAVFLARFDSLPVLRRLHNHCDRLGYPADESARFLSHAIRLPALQTLEIIGSMEQGGMIPQALSSLVSLHFPFWEISDILEYLTGSPLLRQLRLQAPSRAYVYHPPEDTLERVRELAASRCMDIRVEAMSPHCEAAVLGMFDSAALSRLVLTYAVVRGLPEWTPRIQSPRILRHFDRVDKLSMVRRPDGAGFQDIVITAHGPAAKERTLVFKSKLGKPPVPFAEIWAHVSGCPASLEANAWFFLDLEFPTHILTGTKKVIVLLLSGLTGFALMEPFTALDELVFAAWNTVDVPRVTPEEVLSSLPEVLTPGVFLKKLVFQGVILDGDVALLKDVAGTVLVI